MKTIAALIFIAFFTACHKDNGLDNYAGYYTGQRVVITHYNDYDSIFNQYVSQAKFDTSICQLQIIPASNKLDIKELNENNVLIKYWHGVEVNNIGELAYLNPDTAGYGFVSADSIYFHLTFPYPLPNDNIIETSDTVFYSFFYYLSKE